MDKKYYSANHVLYINVKYVLKSQNYNYFPMSTTFQYYDSRYNNNVSTPHTYNSGFAT